MTRIISIIILMVISGCSQQTAKPKVDLKGEEQAVRSISMNWLELWKMKDAAGITNLFLNDGVVYRENQEPAAGVAAIQASFKKEFEQNPKQTGGWVTDSVEVSASGDLAVEYGSWKQPSGGLDGTFMDYGKYITVYKKVNGTWKVSTDFSLSTKPETPVENTH